MIISLDWLSEYIDLNGLSTDAIVRLLTFAGVEVEGIEVRGVASDQIVVAQILESARHPDADRLSVCRVDGGEPTPLQIVCGASNFRVGDKVPLALEGAVLPGDFKIKRTRMRGVDSQGMMCSGKELGMSEDAAGLMILPPDAPVGVPVRNLLGSDTILEVEVTPNRPDLLSHRGLARELAALSGRKLRPFGDDGSGEARPTGVADELIRLEAPDGCPFYSARIIRGVKVCASPEWLQRRLQSIGLRPINNVVDITNFVLHELGQPLHAFDLGKLDAGIVVRRARADESFPALDGKLYSLGADDLVIADRSQAVAIAGVMGGEETAVTEATSDVLLESAWFSPAGVRRTSRKLGLSSDSSYRFERGVDPGSVLPGSLRAAQLIVDLAGGTIEEPVRVAGALPNLNATVPLSAREVEALLGTPVPDERIDAILSGIGLKKSEQGWEVPGFRADLRRPADLIEEVARVTGLDEIPSRTVCRLVPPSAEDAVYDSRHEMRLKLAANGFFEARTIQLIPERQLGDVLGVGGEPFVPLRLRNPLSEDYAVMRPSLLPGLLAAAQNNIRFAVEALRLFEVGTIYGEARDARSGALEITALGVLLSGPHVPSSWLKKAPHAVEFFDLRGAIDLLIARPDLRLKPTTHPALVLAVEITLAGKRIGLAGQLAPARARAMDARHPIHVAELNLTLLEPMLSRPVRFEEIPRFPPVTRDIALEMPASLAHSEFEEFFSRQRKSEPLLVSAVLFDVFEDASGEKLERGRKSLAFSLTYRDRSGTLDAARADAAHSRIIEVLRKSFPITIR